MYIPEFTFLICYPFEYCVINILAYYNTAYLVDTYNCAGLYLIFDSCSTGGSSSQSCLWESVCQSHCDSSCLEDAPWGRSTWTLVLLSWCTMREDNDIRIKKFELTWILLSIALGIMFDNQLIIRLVRSVKYRCLVNIFMYYISNCIYKHLNFKRKL